MEYFRSFVQKNVGKKQLHLALKIACKKTRNGTQEMRTLIYPTYCFYL